METAQTVAGAATEVAIGTAIAGPVGAAAAIGTAAVKALALHGLEALRERRKRQLEEFYDAILDGTDGIDAAALLGRFEDDAALAAEHGRILEEIADEEEEAKGALYVSLQRFLLSAAAPPQPELRRQLLRAVGELPNAALDVLRRISEIGFILRTNEDSAALPQEERDANEARFQAVHSYTEESGPVVRASVQALERWGLISRDEVLGGVATRTTTLGQLLLQIHGA